jgi:hypothetical protein
LPAEITAEAAYHSLTVFEDDLTAYGLSTSDYTDHGNGYPWFDKLTLKAYSPKHTGYAMFKVIVEEKIETKFSD